MKDFEGRRVVARGSGLSKAWCVIAALMLFGCTKSKPDTSAPKESATAATAPSAAQRLEPSDLAGPSALPTDVWRGVCFAHNWQNGGRDGYGSEASAEALAHLDRVGVNWVSITPFGFMPDIDANSVKGEHNSEPRRAAENADRLRGVVAQARERDMNIMLKPHIWIRGGKWRGQIKPLDEEGKLDWKGWWDSHDEWILHYAKLASELDLESLVIGLELHTAVQAHPERLVALAEKVRKVYDGHVTYSANWNEPVPLEVWRALDSVGVQFYPPLVERRNSRDIEEMRKSVREHLDDWSKIAKSAEKPLVITEVGYRSADVAVRFPNAWPEKMKADVDHELQDIAYRVLFHELAETPNLGGVFLWKYFTDHTTDEEGPDGFSPRGKPAEATIERAFDRAE